MNQKRFHTLTSGTFIFLGLAIFLVPESWIPSTISHAPFNIFLLFLSAGIIYLPLLVVRDKSSVQKKEMVAHMQSALAVSLILNNAGELGLYELYQYGFEYDKFCHFLVPMMFAFILAESFSLWKNFSKWKIVWVTFGIICVGGIVWEFFEFSSDFFLNTKIWGVYGNSVTTDTIQDTLFNILGAVAGIIIFLIPSKQQVRKRNRVK